ncbi:MAG: CotH kinase family protein [Saprospiraceae bacterium]
MRSFLFLLTFFLTNLLQAQDLYDLNTIQTIEITFEESNWDQLLDNAYASTGDYILAQSVTINGTAFDSVGVKYKGNSTYQSNQTKNPFHIELDTYKDHEYDDYTDIKLSNVAKDPSFLREVLSYQILRQYMDAPLSNYANVYVNGDLIGLYSNSEAISKKFVNNRFGSKNNTFVKCNPIAGAGPGSSDFPNLEYLGESISSYDEAYELKSDDGWEELIDLCDTLNNSLTAIEMILDVDRAIWMMAFNNVLVNLDSYLGGFKQNYYLYRDDNGRFAPVVWDLNESFSGFTMTGSGNLTSNTQKQQMDHLLHDNSNDHPLIKQLLSVPMYKRMYLAHVKTMVKENFENGTYETTGETLQALIDDAVEQDENKFFTYANFISNLSSDVSGGGGGPGGGSSTIGITNLMDARSDYLLGLSDFTATEPEITAITLSEPNPVIGTNITMTATVSDANQVFIGFRNDDEDRFFRIEMFDDGANNDGAAGDGVYGIDLNVAEAFTQYYIYAENDDIGKFSPQRAEHEYHTFTATTVSITPGDVVINELLSSNDASTADQDGEFDDWIELYNNTSTDIDLSGYSLSDDPDDLLQWTFPTGTTIAADGYLIIWADDDEDQEGLHANFKLSASGETLFLIDATGTIADEVTFATQTTDVSYGRFANGTGDFQLMSPTHGAENIGSVSANEVTKIATEVIAFPNPAREFFTLEMKNGTGVVEDVLIYDLNGMLIYNNTITNNLLVDVSSWEAGIYVVRVGDAYLRVAVF